MVSICRTLGCAYDNPKYAKIVDPYAPHFVPPEERLPMGVFGGLLFAVIVLPVRVDIISSHYVLGTHACGGLFGAGITPAFVSCTRIILDIFDVFKGRILNIHFSCL